jgi:hypothetical protein
MEFNRRQQQQRTVAGDNDEFDNNRRENENQLSGEDEEVDSDHQDNIYS